MRIDWHSSFKAPSPLWTQLLDGLLEPVAEDRLTAEQAIDLLNGRALYTRPVPSKVRSQASGAALDTAPARKPAGKSGYSRHPRANPKPLRRYHTSQGPVGALAGGGVLFALFSAPFWFAGVKLGKQALGAALLRERLSLSRSTFSLSQELATLNSDKQQAQFTGELSRGSRGGAVPASPLPTPPCHCTICTHSSHVQRDGACHKDEDKDDKGDVENAGAVHGGAEGRNQKGVCGETADLLGARVATTMIVNGSPVTVVEVLEGVRVHRFGEGLDWAEQQWLVAEINKAVADLQGRAVVPEHFPPPEPPRIVRDDDSHLHDTQ
ncbi:protein kinase domain-containing protein, partial [Haematococcus lacustris]